MSLRGGIQNSVNNGPVEQIDLINIKQVLVGLSQNATFEQDFALLQRDPLIDAADHIFQPGVERQLHQLHRLRRGDWIAHAQFGGAAFTHALQAVQVQILRLTAVLAGAALHHRHQIDQPADGCGFGRAARAHQQHAAHRPVNQSQHQRDFHFRLANNSQIRVAQVAGLPAVGVPFGGVEYRHRRAAAVQNIQQLGFTLGH